jgi:hypothetical protein
MTGGKPIAVLLQSISGVSAINPLAAFTTSMGERETYYSFILSRTPHETIYLSKYINMSSSSYLYPTKWGRYNLFSSCCDKIRQLFLRPAACLTSTLLETGVDANDFKFSRDQQLNVPSKA